MKHLIALFCTAFLLLALGCDKNPSEIEAVGQLQEEYSAPSSTAKYSGKALPTRIKLKGKIEFHDGTTYQSDNETLIYLPPNLWAKIEEAENSSAESGGTDYYVDWPDDFILWGGLVEFKTYNFPVNGCYVTWKQRIGIEIDGFYNSFYIQQFVHDVENSNVLWSESRRDFYSAPSSGMNWSAFNNFSWTFSSDNDVDLLIARVCTSASGVVDVVNLEGHLNGSNLACESLP